MTNGRGVKQGGQQEQSGKEVRLWESRSSEEEGHDGRGGANALLTLFQPVPYSPPHCLFQVGAPAPPNTPPPTLTPGTQMLRQKTSIVLDTPKGSHQSPHYIGREK